RSPSFDRAYTGMNLSRPCGFRVLIHLGIEAVEDLGSKRGALLFTEPKGLDEQLLRVHGESLPSSGPGRPTPLSAATQDPSERHLGPGARARVRSSGRSSRPRC